MLFKKLGFPQIVIVIFSLFVFGACKQQMEKDEAESHLRAFDHEIVRMTSDIMQTSSYATLEYLSEIPNAPIPYMFGGEGTEEGFSSYCFENAKGIYSIDTINNIFLKTGASDSVIINFHHPELNNAKAKFILAKFKEEPSNSAFLFPTEIDMVMDVANKTVMSITHKATIEYGIPTELDFNGLFDNYNIMSTINTRLRRNSGRLQFQTRVLRSGEEIFDWKLLARLGFEEGVTYRLNRVKSEVGMFPVHLRVLVNNNKIPLKTNDYVTAFNENSTITIRSTTKNQIVGQVELRTRENSDKLDYIVRFKDDSYLFIEDLLISARNILNIKL